MPGVQLIMVSVEIKMALMTVKFPELGVMAEVRA